MPSVGELPGSAELPEGVRRRLPDRHVANRLRAGFRVRRDRHRRESASQCCVARGPAVVKTDPNARLGGADSVQRSAAAPGLDQRPVVSCALAPDFGDEVRNERAGTRIERRSWCHALVPDAGQREQSPALYVCGDRLGASRRCAPSLAGRGGGGGLIERRRRPDLRLGRREDDRLVLVAVQPDQEQSSNRDEGSKAESACREEQARPVLLVLRRRHQYTVIRWMESETLVGTIRPIMQEMLHRGSSGSG